MPLRTPKNAKTARRATARGDRPEMGRKRGTLTAPGTCPLLNSSGGRTSRTRAPPLLPEEEVTDLFEERIERLVARLTAKGPLSRRALARCISGQNYSVIDTLLKEAMRRGLIIQREKLFVATGVNVNASAGKTVIDFSRGVAA